MDKVQFEEKVFSALKGCPLGMPFLAAVSGGADSMAMLSALMSSVPNKSLACIHVDHGLRQDESKGDAEFVRDFCRKNSITCKVVSIPQGKVADFARQKGVGIEAAARFFRRRALLKEAKQLGKNTVILTAHTKDDALELSLMRILRGAGPAGLAAMPVKKGRFLRPLLSMTREDVIAYLAQKFIIWRDDSSNTDVKFLRNRVRHKLIPLLNDNFPVWKKGISGMAASQSLTSEFLKQEAKKRIIWEKSAGCLITDEKNFFLQPQIIREEALFIGINLSSSLRSRLSMPVKRSVVRLFCRGSAAASDFGILRVKKSGGKVVISPVRDKFSESGFSFLIEKAGLYKLKNIDFQVIPFSQKPKENTALTVNPVSSANSFYACLPLIVRPAFKEDFLVCKGRKVNRVNLGNNILSAADIFGTAAFISRQELLYSRDMIPQKNRQIFQIIAIIN